MKYATSWEGRPLHYLIVGSKERIARLDEVKRGMQVLASGAPDADRLIADLPVVVWLLHGVHGNEISSSDAALAEAYHLLAARGNADADLTLRDALVIIDPMQNPDGRQRFVTQNLLGRALEPDPNPQSAEHDEPWPGGRVNHYLFDMNRDYFALSQRETQGRARVMLDWYPQVVVDLHEMGGNSSYYFAPPADPFNPLITDSQRKSLDLFGRANAAEFDRRGFAYFVREVYDAFYPGYGDSWPAFHGAVAMTYEQASARGLSFAREDGGTLTYKDGVTHHFTAAITTAVTAARNRERLLRDYLEYRRGAIALGQKGTREYLLRAGQGSVARRPPRAAAGRAGHPGQAGGRGASSPGRSRCPPGPSSSRWRSRPGGWRATCSSPTSRWTRRSSRSRTGAARPGCRIRSTT